MVSKNANYVCDPVFQIITDLLHLAGRTSVTLYRLEQSSSIVVSRSKFSPLADPRGEEAMVPQAPLPLTRGSTVDPAGALPQTPLESHALRPQRGPFTTLVLNPPAIYFVRTLNTVTYTPNAAKLIA